MSVRPRQQTPWCMTVQLSLTVSKAMPQAYLWCLDSPLRLLQTTPQSKDFSKNQPHLRTAPTRPVSSNATLTTQHTQSCIQQYNITAMFEGLRHFTAGLLGAAPRTVLSKTALMLQMKPDGQSRTSTHQGQQTCFYSLNNSNR